MAKRKRHTNGDSDNTSTMIPGKKIKPIFPTAAHSTTTIQIIAGSYDRVLHGITASISPSEEVQFADTFLFNAHASAVRCLALSPPSAPNSGQSQKIILASGSTDERVNLFHLSAHAPSKVTVPVIPSLTSKAIVENPQNRELGSLLHHSSSITALHFPTRSKLMSSAEDSTVAVTRTRDWSLLSTIKAPIPKPVGRPSGDTAPLGSAPSGVNDFAVHPSMKLMLTVGKGEKCMRLWNLVTGKKAGVLNFGKEFLAQVGEGRHGTGEGRKVAWGCTDAGEEFCVGFERGVLVFGMDSNPRCKVVPEPRTKIHQLCYVQVNEEDDTQLLAASTEDGRLLFYSTRTADLEGDSLAETGERVLPSARLVSQLGGKAGGVGGRIKDFTIVRVAQEPPTGMIIIGASSDGFLRLWSVAAKDLELSGGHAKQVGRLLGAYDTGNRMTCVKAFVMLPPAEEVEEGVTEAEEDESLGSDSDS